MRICPSLLFISLFALSGCHTESPTSLPATANQNTTNPTTDSPQKLSFTTTTIQETVGDCKTPDEACLHVDIAFPTVKEGNAEVQQNINSAVETAIIETLDPGEPGENNPSIEIALDEFIERFNQVNAAAQNEKEPWAFVAKGNIMYASPQIITMRLQETINNGGKIPNQIVILYNFDPADGHQLGIDEWINDSNALSQIVEKKLRQQLKLKATDPFSKANINFPDKKFTLPGNMAMDKDNLVLHYPTMELGEHAKQAIELNIPIDDISKLLKRR